MRCPDCQKFVSFDTGTDPELELEVDDEGFVRGTARIVNTCQECGTELTESTLDVEIDLSQEVRDHRDDQEAEHDKVQADRPEDEREPYDETDHDTVSLESSDGSRTDRRQTKDRHGKPILRSRYQKTFYGVEITVRLECKCGETFEASDTVEVQASGMEQLV